MKTFAISGGRTVLFCLFICFGFMCGSVSGALYGFETGKEGWQAGSWDPGITNAEQSAFWGYGGSDHSLRLDCDLVNGGDNGSAGVAFEAEDLTGTTITMRVYCPAGASGTHGQEWAWTRLRLWVKDGNFGYQETDWDAFPIPPGISIQTVTHTVSSAGGFEATNVTEFGLQICWRGYGTYNGPLYVDAAGYGDPYQSSSFIAPSNEVFSFDVDDEGFEIQTWHDSLAVTNLAQVTGAPDNSTGCLRADVHLVEGHTNFSKGEVFVDMRNEPPFGMTIPANLHNRPVSAWSYCPEGLAGPSTNPNSLQVFCKDSSGRAFYGSPVHVVEESWFEISTIPDTNEAVEGWMEVGFEPTKVAVVGVKVSPGAGSGATFDGCLYIDGIAFDPVEEPLALTNIQYAFETDEEGFVPTDDTNNLAVTSAVQTTAMAAEGNGSLRLDVDLDGSIAARTAGEAAVDLQFYAPPGVDVPLDLAGREIAIYVHCPMGARGNSENPNSLRVFVKDEQWLSEYGTWTTINEGIWQKIILTPSTNEPVDGFMDVDFDPTRIRMLGISFSAGNTSAVYSGPIYVDAVCFEIEPELPSDLRYGFEPNKQGWLYETWEGLESVTCVAQSAVASFEGAHSLRLDVDIDSGTNESKGAASVDMRWYPPPIVRGPFNLEDKKVVAYVYCPVGSQSADWLQPNKLKLFVKDSNWKVEYGPYTAMRNGDWVRVAMVPGWTAPLGEGGHMEDGFNPTSIVQVGIELTMRGTYQGPFYLDHVSFSADSLPCITNTQHDYDFEAECQSRYWKWDTNPDGWNALAWTNTYLAAGEGTGGSTALAADVVFAPTNAAWDYRKGVFEIVYNPPLNLSTKDHRRIQVGLRFDPPVEGLGDFLSSINVFDKNTDQWYWKDFNVGGSSWNILEFDLDDAEDYSEWSPTGPMDASQVGYLVIQITANTAWTGTVYVDDVVVGGVEVPGSYAPVGGGIVQRDGNRFVLDGTNFYFAGANIEYLALCLPVSTVDELLTLSEDLHLDVLRAWAMHEGQDYSFQPERGIWNEMAFENLDRVIAMSGDRGLRLMLAVVDNWGHNGGMFKYMEWVLAEHPESLPEDLRTTNALGSVALHDEFFANEYAKQWYRDYVTALLNRTNSVTGVLYKDDPTVFSWEIVNEPRCETDMKDGRPYGARVHSWIHEMSDFVRGLDPNHMLAAGEEGGYITTFSNATEKGYYQEFHRNYWLYGLRGESNSGAGAMADYLSDYISEDTVVEWQLGTYDNPGEILSEVRAGCSNINFCPFRLYIDDQEYNLWHTNWNGYNQRREWLLEHTRDAHETINKPVVLEEFGFHAFGWAYQGFYGQYQNIPVPKYYEADRVEAYREIYSYIEDLNMDGSFFWNLGYSGMWEDSWHKCEEVGDWQPETGWSDATTISVDSNHVVEGEHSLKLSFDPTKGHGKAIYGIITNEQWVVRLEGGEATGINRVKYFWNVYNPGSSVDVAIAVRAWDPWGDWYESKPQALTTGWNKIRFDLSAGTWKSAETSWEYTGYLKNVLEDIQQVIFLMYGDNGVGELFLDDITIRRDDGFIIYANDPVCPVIREHADHMREKSRDFTVHLAYSQGEDFFPQAQADQSNYTGAACCWMVARYLNGESFTQTQDQIYNATTHNPAHNNEITPYSCASWMQLNCPPGYYFSGRYRTTLADALKEAVYWIDYVPPGGLKSPVYILCNTNWAYNIVRGFQSDRKPYDGGYSPGEFTVYGVWLNDPVKSGLGYNLYVTAAEMTNIYLPSESNGRYWMVAEPPGDESEVQAAVQRMDRSDITLAEARANSELSGFLAGRFGGRSRKTARGSPAVRGAHKCGDSGGGAGGDPDLLNSLPNALRQDKGFMSAFNPAPVVNYYEVNADCADHYYLAAGGERGPGSTRYALKLAPDGSLRQATWADSPGFYQPLRKDTAEWAARREIGGANVTLTNSACVSMRGGSAFQPAWELQFDKDGASVFAVVEPDVDLSGDADNDGMSDGAELYSGFDPDSGTSVFCIEGGRLSPMDDSHLVIEWASADGKTYSISRAISLADGFTRIETGLAATAPLNTYTDSTSAATVYYRIEVE